MLQQTTVAAVTPKFERFVRRFPNLQSLRAASLDDVYAMWEGLGYYRRAKKVWELAQITESLPNSAAALKKLPGIGDYTSAAIAAIAFGERIACVDTNVARVMSRYFASDKLIARSASESLMGNHHPGEWNQAVMELGATTCTSASPNCGRCPLSKNCKALALNLVESFPAPKQKKKTVTVNHVAVVPIHRGKLGLRQIESGAWWEGMWEFPRTESVTTETPLESAHRLGFRAPTMLLTQKHVVTHHKITLHGFFAKQRITGLTWLTPEQLNSLAMPTAQRRLANEALTSVMER